MTTLRPIEANDDKDEELQQLRTLSDFKNQGGIRVTPQVSPQMRFVAKCDKCNIEFISKDVLQKHKSFAHPISVPKPQKVLEPANVHVDPANVVQSQFLIPRDKVLWVADLLEL